MPLRLQVIPLCVPPTELHLLSAAEPDLFDPGLHFLGNVLLSAHHFPPVPHSRASVDTQLLTTPPPAQQLRGCRENCLLSGLREIKFSHYLGRELSPVDKSLRVHCGEL